MRRRLAAFHCTFDERVRMHKQEQYKTKSKTENELFLIAISNDEQNIRTAAPSKKKKKVHLMENKEIEEHN